MTALPGSGSQSANDLTKPGFYQGAIWTDTPQTSGMLIMPYYQSGYWRFQMFFDNNSNHVWFRSGASSSFGTWKQIV